MDGNSKSYKEEISKAMHLLAEDPRTIFLGQTVEYGGSRFTQDLQDIPSSKRLELPVSEEMQMGLSTGMALEGYIPISIYPRFDFLLLATNQVVNHLDKISYMSQGVFKPKVIIKTVIGSKEPYPGPQHCQDYTDAFQSMLKNIYVKKLVHPSEIVPEYKLALKRDISSLLIEVGDLYLSK